MTTKRHNMTTKRCKITTKRHKMTLKRCKMTTKGQNEHRDANLLPRDKKPKHYKKTQTDQKETQNTTKRHKKTSVKY